MKRGLLITGISFLVVAVLAFMAAVVLAWIAATPGHETTAARAGLMVGVGIGSVFAGGLLLVIREEF